MFRTGAAPALFGAGAASLWGVGRLSRFNAVKISRKKGLTTGALLRIIRHNNQTAQTSDGEKYPARQTLQRAPDGGNGAASGWRMDFGGRTERRENALSRDRRASHPLSIGARMMVRVSEWTFLRQFGWYRRSSGFCPMWGRRLFSFSSPDSGTIRVICRPK